MEVAKLFVSDITFDPNDCRRYQDISAGGKEPQLTQLRLYSRPATIGWSSVIIFTPNGGTAKIFIIQKYFRKVSSGAKISLVADVVMDVRLVMRKVLRNIR